MLRFLVFLLLFPFLSKFCEKQTDGFTLLRTRANLPFNPLWETQTEDLAAYAQKFYYLECGGQSYVFLSEDGNYVLKLFKLHRKVSTEKKRKKLNRDFLSYKIAFDQLSQETGVLAVHLNHTSHLRRQVTIVDKLQISHTIDLDTSYYILQKRAHLVYPHIKKLMKQHQEKAAAEAIDSLLEVIVTRCKKGIYDEDARIHRNFGFIENKAVIIDAGRFVPDNRRKDPDLIKQDIAAITKRFQEWLKDTYPSLYEHMQKSLQETYARL